MSQYRDSGELASARWWYFLAKKRDLTTMIKEEAAPPGQSNPAALIDLRDVDPKLLKFLEDAGIPRANDPTWDVWADPHMMRSITLKTLLIYADGCGLDMTSHKLRYFGFTEEELAKVVVCLREHDRMSEEHAEATPGNPWINWKLEGEDPPPQDPRTKAAFAHVLQYRLEGARLANLDLEETPNLYMCMGFASQGYENWASIESALSSWCDENDQRHRAEGTGWILLTNGDGDYGKATVETIAQFVKARGTPVVFVQSDFAYCEPGSAYWPTYASAGFFGEGIYHDLDKLDKAGMPALNRDGTRKKLEVWGGFAKDCEGQRDGHLSYPDAAVLRETFGSVKLINQMGGIFVAGGGDIAVEQVELYGLCERNREGDCFVPANAADGTPSRLNSMHLCSA